MKYIEPVDNGTASIYDRKTDTKIVVFKVIAEIREHRSGSILVGYVTEDSKEELEKNRREDYYIVYDSEKLKFGDYHEADCKDDYFNTELGINYEGEGLIMGWYSYYQAFALCWENMPGDFPTDSSDVIDAELWLYQRGEWGSDEMEVERWYIDDPWLEHTINWNHSSIEDHCTSQGMEDCANGIGWITFDITDLMKAVIDGDSEGILFAQVESGSPYGCKFIRSSDYEIEAYRPRLYVEVPVGIETASLGEIKAAFK